MNIKELSIIVPVYNVEKYLKECLESINEIRDIDYELIIVNDGSPDGSQKIIEEFCKKSKRARYYIKKNDGLSSARNYGLERAKGEYIWFVDSDDIIIAKEFEGFFKNRLGRDAIYGEVIPFLDGEIINFNELKQEEKIISEKFSYIFKKIIRRNPTVWKNIYRREFLEKHKIVFDESLNIGEDLFFNYIILSKTKNILYINDCIYLYRTNREGSIMSDLKNRQKKHYEIAEKMYNVTKGRKVPKKIKKYPIHLYNTWLKRIKERDLKLEKTLWKIKGFYFYKLKIMLNIIFRTYILKEYKK